MAFEPVYEKITAKGQKVEVCERFKVESKTDVNTDTVDKIINVNAYALIGDTVAEDGIIKYSGKAIFYICYLDVENNVKKCESATEFSGEIIADNVNANDKVEVRVSLERATADKGGLKLIGLANFFASAKTFGENSVTAISGGEGVVVNTTTVDVCKSFGIKKGSYPIEEEYQLSYPVAEVLYQRVTPIITAVQCGMGCVIIDGNVVLSSILLQSGDKKDIIKENKTVAFRAEIECEDAMPSCWARAECWVKSFKTDVTVDEEQNSSVVGSFVTLNFSCEAFCSEELAVVEDAFSITDVIKLEGAEFSNQKTCEQKSSTVKVVGRTEIEEISQTAKFLCTCGENVEIVSAEQTDGGISFTGTLFVNAIFKDENEKLFSVRCETSFQTEMEYPFACDCMVIDAIAVAECGNLQIITKEQAEISAEVTFTVFPKEKRYIKYVKDAVSVGVKQKNDSPISVYIPLENEELWSLAKRLNVEPESLIETNKDLQFPLTGKERIVVYRQK